MWPPTDMLLAMSVVGHGIDIVEVGRIARLLEDYGERFIERCFTARESAYAHSSPRRTIERLAGRFAVKEAILKSLGTGWRSGIAWTDMEILPDALGKPVLALSGVTAKEASRIGAVRWIVSLSHTERYAVGSAIALSD